MIKRPDVYLSSIKSELEWKKEFAAVTVENLILYIEELETEVKKLGGEVK